MKTIEQLRNSFTNLRSVITDISIDSLSKNHNLDFDVYLPSVGKNLQRGLVWAAFQKKELIYSIFIGRQIPSCAIVDREVGGKRIIEVIDGKQRLTTLLGFYRNEFAVEIDGTHYFYSDLPKDYQFEIKRYTVRFHVVYENYTAHDKPITDEQKVSWFHYINFAGTPQEK